MSVNSQIKPVVFGVPAGVELSVLSLHTLLSDNVEWLDLPYFIAQKFKHPTKGTIVPQVVTIEGQLGTPLTIKTGYLTLTPDNDVNRSFFLVGDGDPSYDEQHDYVGIKHKVSTIFTVNLDTVKPLLKESGRYTESLMEEVRKLLETSRYNYADFTYTIDAITSDTDEVFREFHLKDWQQYNRLPLQCFRIDLDLLTYQDCDA